MTPTENIQKFEKIFIEDIKRPGADKLLAYLQSSDFYTAPASTKWHLSVSGGLLTHSLAVYEALKKINKDYSLGFSDETMAICGLLHDICKTNFYVKNYDGKYTVSDKFPVPHGAKSVIILQNFIKLADEEVLAIVHHMSGWDPAVKGGDFTEVGAKKITKLVAALQIADQTATFIVEAD